MLLAPPQMRGVVGRLARSPRAASLWLRHVHRPSADDALRFARASLVPRLAAPLVVLLILALTALAGAVPLGSSRVAGRVSAGSDPQAAAVIPATARSEPAGRSAGAMGAAVAVAGLGGTSIADRTSAAVPRSVDLFLGANGTLIKPVFVASRAAGATPVVVRYRTERGDSLWSISHRFGTDTMSIWWANTDRLLEGLRVGQVLAIPPGHGVLHKVIEGDTIWSIAARYGSQPQTIVDANAMRGEVVILGQLLLIPDGHGPTWPKGLLRERQAALAPASAAIPGARIRRLQSGDAGSFDRHYALAAAAVPAAADPLADGALHYGQLVAGIKGAGGDGGTATGTGSSSSLGSGASAGGSASIRHAPATRPIDGGLDVQRASAIPPDGPDGGPAPNGSGTMPAPASNPGGVDASVANPAAVIHDPWGVNASPDQLDAWGLTGTDADIRVSDRSDDADLAARQLQAAAALEEAKKFAAAHPNAPKPKPVKPDPEIRVPSGNPEEGDPGISAADQLKVPPFDPDLARMAADLLRSDLRRFPSTDGHVTVHGQRLPYSGEDVLGVPTRSQLLKWQGTAAERAAGITWLSWPVANGRISQLYTDYHHGVDIVGPSGSLILSAAEGRVVWAGWRTNGGGYQVWIRHAPGLYTAYYHMSSLLVRPGQLVARGKAVGFIGATGLASGTHLHFEVWRDGVPGSQDRRVNALRYAKP